MKILAYTSSYSTNNETNIINQLFHNGLDYLHIYKPKIKKKDLKEFIENIDSNFHTKIVLHQHQILAKKYKCELIHVRNRKINTLSTNLLLKFLRFKNPNIKIVTTISPSALNKFEAVDLKYALVGPIFRKYSEDNISILFDRFKLNKSLAESSQNVFAYGGVCSSNISLVKELGFDGAILNSTIWNSHEPLEEFKKLLFKLKNKNRESRTKSSII